LSEIAGIPLPSGMGKVRRSPVERGPCSDNHPMVCAMPFNVTGNPALAIPTGYSKSGLPLGMPIVGRAFDEPTVLRIAAAYEAACGWINKRPEVELPVAV